MKMPLSMQWLGPQMPNRSTAFLSIKYALLAILVISLVVSVLFFSALVAFDVKIDHAKYPKVDPKTLKTAFTAIMAVSIVISVVGLYGVIREHFITTAIFAGLTLLSTLGKKDDIYSFLTSLLITGMSFVFAAMIKKAERKAAMGDSTLNL